MTYDTWKTTDPRDAELDDEWDLPCSWVEDDTDIYCSYCGAKGEWQCKPEARR